MRVLRLPCKGSWLGAAETEGFRIFLEKPPLEAGKRPGYAENPVIRLRRGLAASQAGTPQSAALTAPLAGEPERVFSDCSRPLCPSSVSLTRASSTFYGIAATGSYVRFNSLRDAPPGGEAFLDHNFTRETPFFHVFLLIFPGLTAGKNGGTICA